MPIPLLSHAFAEGVRSIPYAISLLKVAPWLIFIALAKWYFGGFTNAAERNLHSKVVMMTGGTSGIGAEVARQLASRGAQLVLLTQHALSDPFLVDYIMDLRDSTGNQLITAERVDLSSLHSIRSFATKWIDNAPPRRLDTIILCGNTITPSGASAREKITEDGLELNWGVNFMANFHLLSILSPAIRAQPPDRDVRVIIGTCASYLGGELPDLKSKAAAPNGSSAKKSQRKTKEQDQQPLTFNAASTHATSKLALTTFAIAFQKHLASYKRPDGWPPNNHVILVDPGFCRTPGMRRYLTGGSLWGLLFYLLTWPLWWLVLKSPEMGAQSFLHAAMEASLGMAKGWGPEGGSLPQEVRIIKECKDRPVMRGDIKDEDLQKSLWESSEKTIEELEKRGAVRRAAEKKEKEEREKDEKLKREREEKEKGAGKRQEGSRRSRKAA